MQYFNRTPTSLRLNSDWSHCPAMLRITLSNIYRSRVLKCRLLYWKLSPFANLPVSRTESSSGNKKITHCTLQEKCYVRKWELWAEIFSKQIIFQRLMKSPLFSFPLLYLYALNFSSALRGIPTRITKYFIKSVLQM